LLPLFYVEKYQEDLPAVIPSALMGLEYEFQEVDHACGFSEYSSIWFLQFKRSVVLKDW
jgi:hypothetical protein